MRKRTLKSQYLTSRGLISKEGRSWPQGNSVAVSKWNHTPLLSVPPSPDRPGSRVHVLCCRKGQRDGRRACGASTAAAEREPQCRRARLAPRTSCHGHTSAPSHGILATLQTRHHSLSTDVERGSEETDEE